MPFDAQALWWPPFQKLYDQLRKLELEPDAVPAEALKATLQEYEAWLSRGAAGFLPPSEASRKALESEESLSIGAKKLPVEAGLRPAALDLSRLLVLDEVQAYILLRRWVAKAGPGALLPGAGPGAAASLSPDQRLEVARLYLRERLHLLQSIERLLWEGERADGGPLLDEVEASLSAMLAAGLEEAAFLALQANLEGGPPVAAAAAAAAAPTTLSLAGMARLGLSPLAGGALGGVAGAAQQGGGPGACAAALAEARAAAEADERCCLLRVLMLIYYHPRKQCPPERFISLARLLHARLFTRAPQPRAPQGGDGGAELTSAQLSVKLGTLLLLEMLHVDQALAALAGDQPVSPDSYAFAAPAVRDDVHAELAAWWPDAAAPHSPVLLAWAAVMCLASQSGEGGPGGGSYGAHAARAMELDVLCTLRDLTAPTGPPIATEMYNNIVLSTMAAIVAAFDFSPAALPLPTTQLVAETLSNLFRDQPTLCEGFWARDRAADEPLRHYLSELRGLFPALPTPLYTLLAALSATRASAVEAAEYLGQPPGLASLHLLTDPAIGEGRFEGGDVCTRHPLPLPGAQALMLPQGVVGELSELPPGLSSSDTLWAVPQGVDPDRLALVRWNLPLVPSTGLWVMLARMADALALVQKCPPGPAAAHAAAAVGELAAALRLLSTCCGGDPQTALDLLHVEVPVGAAGAGQRGPDLLSLACHAAAVLAQLAQPPADAIADCFAICAALAEGIPGRVAADLLSLCGVSPTAAAAAATGTTDLAVAQPFDTPFLRRLLDAERAEGRYPATLALLRLLSTLVSAASPDPALSLLLVWALHRVLAEHRSWRYALRADRWRLARAALRLVRLALLSAPTARGLLAGGANEEPGASQGGPAIAAAAAAVLRYDVGMTACLLCALPHHAEAMERSGAAARGEEEVAAVEAACEEWHRLVPVLLPPGSPGDRLAPAAFFRPCPPAGGGGGGAQPASAAAVLLSYISYPYFSSARRALVLRSMHCLAVAAADAAPATVFALLLPQEGGGGGLASAARAAIAAAFAPEAAAGCPALAGAACDALGAAVRHHPSLLDALLFPCPLEQALVEKERANGAATAAPNAEGSAPAAEAAGKPAKGSPPPPRRGCLDAVWQLLGARERLQAEQPAVLAKLMQVLAAFWQCSGTAYRAVAVLQGQPGLWGHLLAVVEAAAQAPPLQLPPAVEGAAAQQQWAGQEAAIALLAAEAAALQILAAECYAWAATPPGAAAPAGAAANGGGVGPSAPSMPAELADFLRQLPEKLVSPLLERYCAPLPTHSLLLGAQRAAAAAGLQLLGAALSDEVLWPSAAEGGTALVPRLEAAAQPLLHSFPSQAEAARVLAGQAPRVAAHSFPAAAAARAVSRLLLQQAEVPGRAAPDRDPGPALLYDRQQLARRLGGGGAARQLGAWLDGASLAASLEDARLAGAAALKALLSAAHRLRHAANGDGGSGGGVPAAAVQAALGLLCDALADLSAQAKARAAPGVAEAAREAAFDPAALHLAAAAEAASALLLLAQRWAAGPVEDTAAVGLCAGLLQAAGDWMAALERNEVAGAGDGSDGGDAAASIVRSLLAAALVLLPIAPAAAAAPGPPSEAQRGLVAAATRLLPLLLAACHRQPPQLVLVVSLAAALVERLVPPSAWLPLVRGHLHFGSLLHSLLLGMHAAAQQRAAAAAPAADPTAPPPLALPGPSPPPALGAPGQQQQQQQQQSQQQGGGLGPLAAASVEEAALLLALQVARARGGAQLLLEQGAVQHALAIGKWLLAAEGGNLMGEIPLGGGGGGDAPALAGRAGRPPPRAVIDYSNAYLQDGSPNPAHRLWCCVLGLLGAVLAALPGHAAVEEAALRLAVEAEARLLLAAEPPAASPQQPLTLAMAQEAKYTLFLLCGLSRLEGQWRLLLPDSLPAFRRATAALLEFIASPGKRVRCAPVASQERAAARADEAGGERRFNTGWFGVAAAGSRAGKGAGVGARGAAVGGYAWQLAERQYSCAQYALAFQLAVAPQVGEEEVAGLGPEWVKPDALLALQASAVEVAAACKADGGAAARRVARTLQALLGLSTEMQDRLGVERTHRHKQAVAQAIDRLGRLADGGR